MKYKKIVRNIMMIDELDQLTKKGITYRMELMNQFIDSILIFNNNIIFKGAVALTNRIKLDKGIILGRKSLDIDADCIEDLTQEEIVSIIQKACDINNYKLIVKRDLGDNKSLGLNILNTDDKQLFAIDIGKKLINNYEECYTISSNTKYKGYSIERVIIDKLSVVSSRKVYRRIKDLYDLYIILNYYEISLEGTINGFKVYNRLLGYFEELGNYSELEHAYIKYDAIYSKKDFGEIYKTIQLFITPILNYLKDEKSENLIWNPARLEWVRSCENITVDDKTHNFV